MHELKLKLLGSTYTMVARLPKLEAVGEAGSYAAARFSAVGSTISKCARIQLKACSHCSAVTFTVSLAGGTGSLDPPEVCSCGLEDVLLGHLHGRPGQDALAILLCVRDRTAWRPRRADYFEERVNCYGGD